MTALTLEEQQRLDDLFRKLQERVTVLEQKPDPLLRKDHEHLVRRVAVAESKINQHRAIQVELQGGLENMRLEFGGHIHAS